MGLVGEHDGRAGAFVAGHPGGWHEAGFEAGGSQGVEVLWKCGSGGEGVERVCLGQRRVGTTRAASAFLLVALAVITYAKSDKYLVR